MTAEEKAKFMSDILARLGEVFDDYLVIARPDRDEMMFRATDSNWAIGAMSRAARVLQKETINNEDY